MSEDQKISTHKHWMYRIINNSTYHTIIQSLLALADKSYSRLQTD